MGKIKTQSRLTGILGQIRLPVAVITEANRSRIDVQIPPKEYPQKCARSGVVASILLEMKPGGSFLLVRVEHSMDLIAPRVSEIQPETPHVNFVGG